MLRYFCFFVFFSRGCQWYTKWGYTTKILPVRVIFAKTLIATGRNFLPLDVTAKWKVKFGSVGKGRNARTPPSEMGKIVVETWFCLPGVYTFWEEAEVPKIFSKKLWKLIFHRDFDQKISKISWKISKFSSFLVQMSKTLHRVS